MTAPLLTIFGSHIQPHALEHFAQFARTFLERPLMIHRRRTGQLWERLAERAETGKV